MHGDEPSTSADRDAPGRDEPPAPPPRRRSRVRRLAVTAIGLAVAFGVSLFGYACASVRSLDREIASTPRDPETGVVLGTEAESLGDPNAETACLLLHGFVGSKKDLADLGERLAAEGHYVRLTRLPGHGTTPRDHATVTADELIEAAREELHALQDRFDRVHVVGFSMGASIATLLAAQESFDRLVLVAPYYEVTYFWYYVLPPDWWNAMLSPIVPYVMKTGAFIKINRREAIPHIFSYGTVSTRAARVLDELGERAGQEDILRAIDEPLLMLHAQGDEAASPRAARRAFELFGSADKTSQWYGKRSNHLLLWDYDGEDAMERIVEFLTQ